MGERMTYDIIVTGSEGLVGSGLCEFFTEKMGYKIMKIDYALGHDLSNEKTVKALMSKNKARAIVNLFAINDHIRKEDDRKTLFDLDLREFDVYLNTNVTAMFSVCREFAKNNDCGRIINFSSHYGIVSPNPNIYKVGEKNIAYGVSKAAVIQLTKHLAVHLAPRFLVNCVVPAGISNGQSKEFHQEYSKLTPLRRMMEVEEIFGIVEFLVSVASSYCTGQTYIVDGGYTAW